MKSIQQKRRESILFQEISNIISQKIQNTNISYTTVTDIEFSNDQTILKIYVTFENDIKRSFKYLNHTKGFIRFQLSKLNVLKKIPKIIFKMDNTQEKATRINNIIKEINTIS